MSCLLSNQHFQKEENKPLDIVVFKLKTGPEIQVLRLTSLMKIEEGVLDVVHNSLNLSL